MKGLWEILLPMRDEWPAWVDEHIGSVYVPRDSTAFEVVAAARERFGENALAYRRSGSDRWTMIQHERIH